MANKKTAEIKAPKFSTGYRQYVLLALTGVYIFNFIDRQIIVILQEGIKEELALSDTQLGLLSGFAFAIFYVTMGIPIARLADRYSRRNIIGIALTVWSTMTVFCGLAVNYTQLLLARMGVGVGEAGGSPPAHSMISDYFPKEKRATALSVYSMGIYFGVLFGYLFGGWLNEYFGWRHTLIILGIPGIIYALLFFFTVKEPPRGYAENIVVDPHPKDSMWSVFRLLANRKTFVLLAIASGLHTFVTYGMGNWFPSFLVRIHEMGSGEIGTWLGLGTGIGGALGTFLGGYLADKFGRIDRRWYLLLPAITIALSIPLTIWLLLAENKYLVLSLNILNRVLWGTYLGPCLAMTHNLVGIRMRALSSAIYLMILNFIGLGFGPPFFGFLSDLFAPSMGIMSLRWALITAIFFTAAAAVLFWIASQTLERDLEQAPS